MLRTGHLRGGARTPLPRHGPVLTPDVLPCHLLLGLGGGGQPPGELWAVSKSAICDPLNQVIAPPATAVDFIVIQIQRILGRGLVCDGRH